MPNIELIRSLLHAQKPDRVLDRLVATEIGYIHDTSGDRDAWIDPAGERVLKLPKFTDNAQDASELVIFATKSGKGACSWEDGRAAAKVGESRICSARTPAIALCVAALVAKWSDS